MKKFASVLALNLLIVGCATVTPNKIQDDKSSYDASTPKQYQKDNGGLISFVGDDALITPQARERYNNLIGMYKIKFKKGVYDLKNDFLINKLKIMYNFLPINLG